jgi:hypothetical protein
MPGRVRDAFKLYLNQEPRRSLRRLAEECARNGVKASEPTLKRWSTHFGWQRHVADHDQALAEQAKSITHDQRRRAIDAQLKMLYAALDRYDLLVDPHNPRLTPAQRRRATVPTVRDFLKIIEIEERLWKQLEAATPAEPERSKQTYTAEELDAMMRALAEVRHGLPGAQTNGG